MCLSTIDKKMPPKSGWFWKVFILDSTSTGEQLKGRYYDMNTILKRGTWLKARSPLLDYIGDANYLAGFHGYETQKEGNPWVGLSNLRDILIKVRYRRAICAGRQTGSRVIVAHEIFIPKEKKHVRSRSSNQKRSARTSHSR